MEQNLTVYSVSARCVVCGREVRAGQLCERCRESLALCDVEDYVVRKTSAKNCRPARANAFK